MNFTQDELQTLYSALIAYGNALSDCAKKFSNEDFTSIMSNKAKRVWELARNITDYMED